MGGIVMFKYLGQKANWRLVVLFCTALSISLGIAYWLVVFGHLRNQWFVVFLDAGNSVLRGISYLVMLWVTIDAAPKGLEASTFMLGAIVTSAGQSLGTYVALLLNAFFDVQEADVVQDSSCAHWGYIWNTLCVAACQISYVLFFHWMPANQAELIRRRDEASKSKCRPFLLLALVST